MKVHYQHCDEIMHRFEQNFIRHVLDYRRLTSVENGDVLKVLVQFSLFVSFVHQVLV